MLLPRGAAAMLAAALVLAACGPQATVIPPSETPSAAPVPPTPSITPTVSPPAPTATLAPAPRTFTEGFDAGVSYWQFLRGGAADNLITPAVQAGALRFDLPDADAWAYAIYADQVYEDVRIDAVVDFGTGVGSAAGVICRYDAALGWYEFNIYADSTYAILFGQWLADGIARYTPLVVSQSDQISPTANEIGLVCQDDVLTPYVNLVQLRRRQETQHVLTAGQVGVSAASSNAPGQAISFDWVSVGSP